MSMETAFLGDIMIERQKSIDPKKSPEANFALYSIPGFDAGEPEICMGDAIGSTKKCLEPGDVVLSRIIPHIRRAWVVGDHDVDHIVGSSEWIVFRSPKFHGPYLRHIVTADPFHAQFMNTVAGVGGSLVRARPKAAAQIKIPLPPLEEQRRIAGILDAADALRRRRREALALLDTLPGAIFAEETEQADNWESVRFGDLVEIGSGNGFPIVEQGQVCGKYPFLKVGDMTLPGNEERLTNSRNWIDDDARSRLKAKVFREGAIVFPKIGAAIATNKKRVLAQDSCVDNNVMVATPKEGVSSRLILEVLRRKNLSEFASTSNPPSMRKGTVEEWELKFPKTGRRAAVEQKLFEIDAMGRNYRAQLSNMETLFASLQSRAFAGEL